MTRSKLEASEGVREIRLKDYRPPPFLVDKVDLDVELGAAESLVTSTLVLRRAPDTPPDAPLVLDGKELELLDLAFEGRMLSANEYHLDEDGGLVLPTSFFDREQGGRSMPAPYAPFSLRIRTRIFPERNTGYKGLYASNGILCTQCEAEDFRRITFYPDRPDVLARFTTTLRAAQDEFPVLLSNGNLAASGKAGEGRHWVRWEDPFPKPCYLFALVAGDLACVEGTHVTASGREIQLRIYTEAHNVRRCGHAVAALGKAMRWDEEAYGLECDLDLYMIVAVDHFNMGAMENKGLNVFNSKYVLADRESATDTDFANIDRVVAHEYFHNWTGNRVTCRDWHQVAIKEGVTVFRDQQFTAAMGSCEAMRIREARFIRDLQFKEDAGPDSHPVRPSAYRAIDNFYTVTVYFKGAEVIRMMHTLLGGAGFRRGMDLYFERHDGAAVTTDDFVSVMEDAAGIDLEQFRRWYSQAGTPCLRIDRDYDPARRTLVLRIEQRIPAATDGSPGEPMHIPLALGLLDRTGRVLIPDAGTPPVAAGKDGTLLLDIRRRQETIRLNGVEAPPLLSLLRGFSAPVTVEIDRSDEELIGLLAHDSDPFARWDAGQQLALVRLERLIATGGAPEEGAVPADPPFVEALRSVLRDPAIDGAFASELLTLPSESNLADRMDCIDVEAIHEARRTLHRALGEALANDFASVRQRLLAAAGPYRFDAEGAARRSLANTCLAYLAATDTPAARTECLRHFLSADNMTDSEAALGALADLDCEERVEAMARFERRWQGNPLVMDKWLSLQATSARPDTLERVTELLEHPVFDLANPNRVRALVHAFCFNNPVRFHAADGSGYRFWSEQMRELDPLNPEGAARLAGAVSHFRRYDDARREAMATAMEEVLALPALSKNSAEVLGRALGDSGRSAPAAED